MTTVKRDGSDGGSDPATPRRRTVLDVLRAAGGPLGVSEVAERVGVHANTARFHLDSLVTHGAVERTLEASSGPGRPRAVYAPRPGMDRGGRREYQLLARMLLSRLASTGSGAEAAAVEAGRAWGRHLIESAPPFHTVTDREAVDRLVGLLVDLGFEPATTEEPGDVPDLIRLRHCPFLELAEEYRQIVCPLHLGMMKGALAELRAPVDAGRLEPFAEPDVCHAHLVHTRAA
ncbi:helix-turn-helix transcriptional regulator [Streptomyces hirsutus]|uniref:helix-turn-helix transcriptional regulator n=1 Tax=Streptomyces hirsutus TaxID=35620 RepID=UPI000AB539F8|nr:helix-turn-helix domain-containing protein [Streptomyces hirsutus]